MMNRYSFTRSLFVVLTALLMCVPMVARDLNPFAFKLSEKLEGDVFTVTYYLNAQVDKVSVLINVEGTEIEYDCTNAKNTVGTTKVKGIYHVPISLREKLNNNGTEFFRDKTNLSWRVSVLGGNTNSMPADGGAITDAFVRSHAMNHSKSVDIDNDLLSENFGMIYVTNATTPSSSNSNDFSLAGLYVFDPAFQNMPPKGDDYYNFATPDTRTHAKGYNLGLGNAYGKNEQSLLTGSMSPRTPCRVRIAEDGRIFVTTFSVIKDNLKKILLQLNPKRLSYNYRKADGTLNDSGWVTNIFDGVPDTNDADYFGEKNKNFLFSHLLETSAGKFMAAPNIGFDVREKGANLKLLMLSGDAGCVADPYNIKSVYLHYYKLGNKTTWTAVPTGEFPDAFNFVYKGATYQNTVYFNGVTQIALVVAYDATNVEYDQYGGFWLCQYRAQKPENPSLMHVNASGKCDYMEKILNRNRGGVRYNNDHTKLAVAGGKVTGSGENISAEIKYATIYTMKHTSATTAPQFTSKVYLQLQSHATDFAWDYANNLYVTGGSSKVVSAYALPHGNNPVSTPCRDTSWIEDTYKDMLTVKLIPNNINAGTATDNDFVNKLDKHNETLDGFNFYYRKSAKFQLLGQPATGYRFYQWDDEPIGQEVSSQTTMVAGGVTRTAKFGIDAWETKAITPITTEVTFPGVFVQRELDNESYSTICLPFELKTLTGTPYEGASVLKFVGVEKVEENGVVKANMKFAPVEFTDADYMRPGVPYLIKVLNPILGGEEVIFKQAKCPVVANPNPYGGVDVTTTESKGFAFRGILNPATFPASKTNLFLVADNRLANLYESSLVYGMRGYFTVPEGYDASKIQIKIMDKTATSVETTPNTSIVDSMKVVKYMWNGKIYIKQGNKLYDITGIRVK